MYYCSTINDLSHYHMPPHNDISDDVYTGILASSVSNNGYQSLPYLDWSTRGSVLLGEYAT